MPVEIPSDLPPELVPLSWLVGEWAGDGFVGYGDAAPRPFRQHVQFAYTSLPYLEYRAESHLLDDDGRPVRPIGVEHGFWQLDRPQGEQDLGPGLMPPGEQLTLRTAQEVEALRRPDGGFPLVVTVNHPGGMAELYVGEADGPRIQLGTDAVVRSGSAKEYTAATRMLGLVEGRLFWAWDMAASGSSLAEHASAQLDRL